jgi:hypothetical protein
MRWPSSLISSTRNGFSELAMALSQIEYSALLIMFRRCHV